MTDFAHPGFKWWRVGLWGTAAVLLAIPAISMQFDSGFNWDETDFILIGTMLAIVCGLIELAVRASGHIAFRAGAGVAVVAGFLLVWINLAVGIIGAEGNPANLMYVAVLAAAIGGTTVAGSSTGGMTRAMLATACAQTIVAAIAFIGGLGANEPPGPAGILALNGFFVVLWLLSAWLFGAAARNSNLGDSALNS